MSARDLSPAQILVLDAPDKSHGPELILAGVRWLTAHGHLLPEPNHSKASAPPRLTLATPLPAGAPHDLAAVLTLVRRDKPLTARAILRGARDKWGRDLVRYQAEAVLPSLIAQGLVEPRTKRHLLVFSRTRHYRTPDGEALNRRVVRLLSRARAIPAMLDHNPARAAALATAAGGLVLLLPELEPRLDELAAAVASAGTSRNRVNGAPGSGTATGLDVSLDVLDAPEDQTEDDASDSSDSDGTGDSGDAASSDSASSDSGSDGGGDGGGGGGD